MKFKISIVHWSHKKTLSPPVVFFNSYKHWVWTHDFKTKCFTHYFLKSYSISCKNKFQVFHHDHLSKSTNITIVSFLPTLFTHPLTDKTLQKHGVGEISLAKKNTVPYRYRLCKLNFRDRVGLNHDCVLRAREKNRVNRTRL